MSTRSKRTDNYTDSIIRRMTKASLVYTFIFAIMLFSLTGCSNKKDKSNTPSNTPSVTVHANEDTTQSSTENPTATPTEEPDKTLKFRYEDRLLEHFNKHGDEFGYATAEEYLAGANRVINSPDALHKNEAEDGDDIYYLESTNEIVFVSSDGYIRTYFKPDDGINYYNRQ